MIIWTYHFVINDIDGSNQVFRLLAESESTDLLRVDRKTAVARSDLVADLEAVNRGARLDDNVNVLMLSCEEPDSVAQEK